VSLRRWLSDVLTASRYCQSLEQRIIQERQDMTERLGEKDARIKELRTELAGLKLESDRMRLVLMPLGSPAGAMYAERFNREQRPQTHTPEWDGPEDWQSELQRMIKQEEAADGTHSERREAVHEPATDASA
jgi:HPt (histidine-containing phosphotransfer) domain-containing protein